ncbi:MAG: hypothetical protein SOW20_04575 [Berryella intestinalis]|uniref:hypothetical protein n=1 Tax=Berryella intestinalis TaxID=1531429 RepID=UPI002A74C634|nr:hypothetical protein [Berryella intestinalis]MDY3129287.1 hypothetical protein [Berryella intestinalis]
MKYGLTRKLNVYGLETKKGEEVIATAGDYLQSQLWCSSNLNGVDGGIADFYQTFAWAWFALKRNGKLEEYGIAAEITQDALTDMASTVTVYMEAIEDDSLPLAGSATPRKR